MERFGHSEDWRPKLAFFLPPSTGPSRLAGAGAEDLPASSGHPLLKGLLTSGQRSQTSLPAWPSQVQAALPEPLRAWHVACTPLGSPSDLSNLTLAHSGHRRHHQPPAPLTAPYRVPGSPSGCCTLSCVSGPLLHHSIIQHAHRNPSCLQIHPCPQQRYPLKHRNNPGIH